MRPVARIGVALLFAGCMGSSGNGSAGDGGSDVVAGGAAGGAAGVGAAGGANGGADADAGSDAGVLGPDSFGGMHVDDITYDCQQTVECQAQRGVSLPDDPVDDCVKATARLLGTGIERQQKFLANFARCRAQVVCAYYDCALADASGYGETQRPRIERDCMESMECQMDSGISVGADAFATCVASSITAVDVLPNDRRLQFETAFDTCSNMNAHGCAWVNCFVY